MISVMFLLGVLLLGWAGCIIGTGLLFKASGRAATTGRLIGFFLGGTGILIGLIMLAKGPPKPRPEPTWDGPGIEPTLGLYRQIYHPPGANADFRAR